MVDGAQLVADATSLVVSTALPGIVWAMLFVFAWMRPAFADSLGLGRREFWILFPGALAGTFAIVPIAPISIDVLAISLSGAILPLGLAARALGKVLPPARGTLAALFSAIGLQSAILLLAVLPSSRRWVDGFGTALGLPEPIATDLAVTLLAAIVLLAIGAFWATGEDPTVRGRFGTLVATSAALVLTFVGTSAIAGVGIVETFPYFLIPPVGVGIAIALSGSWLFRGVPALALPAAFFAGGWGTAVGADVLRQPGLYGSGPPGLYVIGGAGLLDLVYLSGFLSLGGAYVVHVLLDRASAPVGPPAEPSVPRASTRLEVAYARGLRGDLPGSLRASVEAAHAAADTARAVRLGSADAVPARPWDGLPAPGWVVSDLANLESAARAPTNDPVEALRGWLTARFQVRFAYELSRERYASARQRVAAFLVDLLLIGGGAGALFAALALAVPGNLGSLLGGLGYNTAIYAAIAGAFVYFVLADYRRGRSVGKRLLGLEVRDRHYRRPGGTASLARNLSLLPTITLVVVGLSLAIAIAVKGFGSLSYGGLETAAGFVAVAGIAGFVAGGVLLFGAIGLLAISLSYEHQRVGDVWGETWVVRSLTERPASAPPSASPPPDRSG